MRTTVTLPELVKQGNFITSELLKTSKHLQRTDREFVGIGVLTAVVSKVAIFWDIAPCSLYMNQRLGSKSSRSRNKRARYTALYPRSRQLSNKEFICFYIKINVYAGYLYATAKSTWPPSQYILHVTKSLQLAAYLVRKLGKGVLYNTMQRSAYFWNLSKDRDRREMKWQENGVNSIMRNVITCTLRRI
jgi:hypothetical protein